MKTLKIILGLCLLTNSSLGQVADDDLLLMVVPSIAAVSKNRIGLEKVSFLHGQWKFYYIGSYEFEDFYRFDKATARASTDPSIYLIDGQGSLYSDFSVNWCTGGMIGSFSTKLNEYLVLCDWGFPEYDAGSAYFLTNAHNSFYLIHHFYIPSTGAIQPDPSYGHWQRISSSYLQINSEALSNSRLKNQNIADQKQVRYKDFIKQSTRQADSAKALSEGDHSSSAEAQIKAVSQLINRDPQ